MQTRLACRRLVPPIGRIREGQGDQFSQGRPAESNHGRLGARQAGRGEPLLVEGGACDGILEAVVEAMDEDEQIASRIGQVVDRILAEPALFDILDRLDGADRVGGEVGVLHIGCAIGDEVWIGRRDDALAIALQLIGGAVQDTVGCEVNRRWHEGASSGEVYWL